MKLVSSKILGSVRAFKKAEDGTTMVEFAICIALFLLILFAVLDFGRLGYNWVVTEKAMQQAVRIAAVRTPVCTGVPTYHRAPPGTTTGVTAGDLCRSGPNVCESTLPATCLLSEPEPENLLAAATATEIWTQIQALMPNDATTSNVFLSYEYDSQLGFLGGPYVPKITVRLVGNAAAGGTGYDEFQFTFITPLSALAANASGETNNIPGSIPFPAISVTLPAEEMNIGVRG